MKILQVVHGFPPHSIAGTEVYTQSLSYELSRRHEVFLFFRISDLKKEEYVIIESSYDGVKAFAINNTFRSYESFEDTYRNTQIAKKFAILLDKIKPDIVHIQHVLYLGAGLIEEIYKRGIPIVFTLQDYWLLCPQGQFLKDNMQSCASGHSSNSCVQCTAYQLTIKKNIFRQYYFLRQRLSEASFRIVKNLYLGFSRLTVLSRKRAAAFIRTRDSYIKGICSRVDLFISPSQFMRNAFLAAGIEAGKIDLLTYGLDANNLISSTKSHSSKIRFGFIGNLLPAKAAHILIQAFNGIKDTDAVLNIFGRSLSCKGELLNYAGRLKKSAKNKNIYFLGGFSNQDVSGIFADIDVLVVPSIWPENSPLVIQEGFLSGTPVIASRIGGIPELVSDGINGLLFNPGEAGDLRRKIQYIIDNRDILRRFNENAPKIKDIEENAREIEEIYAKLINNKNMHKMQLAVNHEDRISRY